VFEARIVAAVKGATSPVAHDLAERAQDDGTLAPFRSIVGAGITEQRWKSIDTFVSNSVGEANAMADDLKREFARTRPSGKDRDSFPSGHATRAGVRYRLLAAIAPQHEPELLREAWLMCLDRIVLEKHHPSDVAAGFALGETVAVEILRRAQSDPGSRCARDYRAAKGG
jgi:hypothetical protein